MKAYIGIRMAKPLESIPTLKGKDALNFLKEKDRIESLKPSDREYKNRKKFFDMCIATYERIKVTVD